MEIDLFLDGATNLLLREAAPCGGEFDVAEAVDSDEGEQAKDKDDRPDEISAGEAREQCQDGEEPADAIEDERRAAGSEAEREDHVMDVRAIAFEDGGAAQETSPDGESDINERECKCHEGRGHAKERSGLLTPDKAEAAEDEADGEAAAISEEDGGGTEVVAQKGEQAAGEGDGGHGETEVAGEDGDKERGDGSEQADTGREAVHSVDEVDGVGTTDEPDDAEENGEPRGSVPDGEPCAERDGEHRGDDLTGELLPWLEAEDVVGETEEKDEACRGKECAKQGCVLNIDPCTRRRKEEDETECACVGDDDGDAADARHSFDVRLTIAIRSVDDIDPDEEIAEQRRYDEAEKESSKAQYQDSEHRSLRRTI